MNKPEAGLVSDSGVNVWVDGDPPPHDGPTVDIECFYELAPSPELYAALEAQQISTDAFTADYELELDQIPLARFSTLIRGARDDRLALISRRALPAHVLRRYIDDLVAMTDADDRRLAEAGHHCALVAERAYREQRAAGATHTQAVRASRQALRDGEPRV
ncbi:hypothetical protein [Salinisphaera sp. T31B1]|uniref:DUF488 family protein, N3 subclade n=1 Tax=Salinisphaera sp. T31B1 TaxID=727963 RepID=UPI0033411BE1